MRRTTDRLSVFGLAMAIQAAADYLLGAPPDGRPTWLAWALSHTRQLASLPPRLRVFAPFAASLAAIRAASLIEQTRPGGPSRIASIVLQAILLAATFDAFRGLRASATVEGQLRDAPVDDQGRPTAALDAERVEAEIGRLANAPSESVVGPWAAYAAFDLSGAVAYAAVESLGGPMAGPGSDGPLAAMLDPARRLVSVRRGRDAIAAAATLAARGRSDLQAPELEELALGSETPIPVTAMSVALDRRASWNGRSVGWQRPPPEVKDIRRARRLHLKSLGVLALTAVGVIAISDLFRPPGSDND
ncbi:MAG: hypothetical protein F4066_11300 [Chloroflexi bacterium]|nr:hypothetical protein [Chloroflexota bacterium]MYB22449.1 hypothetical protein [Chloroflexota bacterium]MYD16615.1 hypothetical protein [Chloroflexota bacterium]MYF80755.1 hypothetical protein [Chloroflexota bacterium]MYI05425.1 hypothetical protein [Chloroflexota bacterium]